MFNQYGQIDFVQLLESDPSGNKMKVMIIEEGLSNNRKLYSESVLRKSIPLFEKSKVNFFEFDKKFFNHLPLTIEKVVPQGFPLQIAGFFENVKFETVTINGKERRGLTACLNFLNTDKAQELKQTILDAWSKGIKDFIGLSINAAGDLSMRMLNGLPVCVVHTIKQVLSTEFVSRPSAGGCLLNLIESINEQGGSEKMFKKLLEKLKQWKPAVFESIDINNVTQEEAIGIFQNVVKEFKDHKDLASVTSLLDFVKAEKFEDALGVLNKLHPDQAAAPAAAVTGNQSQLSNQAAAPAAAIEKKPEAVDTEKRFGQIEQRMKKQECKDVLAAKLAESKLPEPYKKKVKKRFEDKIFQESEVDDYIKEERDTLAALVESQSDFDLGDVGGAFVGREPKDRLQASMDLMLGEHIEESEKEAYEGVEAFSSLKEAYIAFTDDPLVTGRMGQKALKRMREADSTTFAYALGFSMQRRMVRDYRMIDPLWKKIANTVSVRDFKLQERILWGGFGQLPQVLAARTVAGTPIDSTTPTYPELGFPTDQESTYAVGTKGGIVTLTRRMVIDDDLDILRKIVGKLGRAAANTLNRFVFDLMLNVSSGTINGGTIYDTIALYATAHKNLRTGVLSHDNLRNLMDDMYHQVEFGNKTLITDNPLSSSSTTVNVTAGTGQYFKAGDMLWAEGELMLVSSVSTDALTVTRGLFGTTGAAHVQNTILYKATEILAIEMPTLWVPRALRSTALALKGSQMNPETAENEINTIRDSFDPIVSPFLRGNESNYYLSARPEDMEGIEVGFLQGREDPEIFVQDNPLVDNTFIYDQIRHKVRHEYGGCVVDFRAFAASIPT